MRRMTARPARTPPPTDGPHPPITFRSRLQLTVAVTVTALAVATVGAACGGDSSDEPQPMPAAQSFTPGACQTLAPSVLDTMRIIRADHGGPDGLNKLADELTPPQERLYDQIAAAGPHAAEVERVTTAIGWLRLRVAADSYEPALLTEVTAATDALVDSCT